MTTKETVTRSPVSSGNAHQFADFREHLSALESRDLLRRINRNVKIETEVHPLVRLQFLGLKENMRKGFLFENVSNVKGKKFDGSVAVGCLAASHEVYSIGMGCGPDEVEAKWRNALANPIEPRIVQTGPVRDEIHKGNQLLEHGGLGEFPFPISTPGFDNAPYFTACGFLSKDPETGIPNVGNYRAQIKSPSRTGLFTGGDMVTHWEKCRKMGRDLEVAAVIGAVPVFSFAAVTKLPYGVSEYAVAGGLQGAPLDLVRCETVDLEVPATAEIVVEGVIKTDYLEPEGPFGESSGYVDPRTLSFAFEATCITHRKNPIVVSILSQFTPSESSKIKHRGMESVTLDHLRRKGFDSVIKVAHVEPLVNLRPYVVVQMKKKDDKEPWRVMEAVLNYRPEYGKILVCVDEDINPEEPMAVIWAICHRAQLQIDSRIMLGRQARGPMVYLREATDAKSLGDSDASLLIDATKKFDMPPVSLPTKEYMEHAIDLWKQMGLPELELSSPWFGYSLGFWPDELAEEAKLAVNGDFYQTGEKLHGRKVELKEGESPRDARRGWTF